MLEDMVIEEKPRIKKELKSTYSIFYNKYVKDFSLNDYFNKIIFLKTNKLMSIIKIISLYFIFISIYSVFSLIFGFIGL
jgi:hypothetical protein